MLVVLRRSAIMTSVVSSRLATDAAFCSARCVTLADYGVEFTGRSRLAGFRPESAVGDHNYVAEPWDLIMAIKPMIPAIAPITPTMETKG
jgi:hypothetical protein